MNGQRDDEYGSLNDLMGSFEDPVEPETEEPRSSEPDSVEPDPAKSASAEPDPAGAAPAESDPAGADWVPEGLPAEYLEAFRRGYERARRGEEATVALERELAAALESDRSQSGHEEPAEDAPEPVASRQPEDPTGEDEDSPEPVASRQSEKPAEADVPTAMVEVREQRRDASEAVSDSHEATVTIPAVKDAPPSRDERADTDEERRWPPVPMVALAGVALVLILAAFGVGRLFADDGDSAEAGSESSVGAESSGGGSEAEQAPYDGPVDAVAIAGGNATCQSASSVDAAGTPATYEPAKAFDSDLSTAWRCDGSGKGQRFTITLPQETTVAELGLVPGYAKTDPVSGADRYAENNRITKVRWRFDDGTTYVQRMKGSAANRSMRTIRIPETSTTTLVIEILRSKAGPRNTVAISEIRVATPAG